VDYLQLFTNRLEIAGAFCPHTPEPLCEAAHACPPGVPPLGHPFRFSSGVNVIGSGRENSPNALSYVDSENEKNPRRRRIGGDGGNLVPPTGGGAGSPANSIRLVSTRGGRTHARMRPPITSKTAIASRREAPGGE
jgi:hypothetical protein